MNSENIGVDILEIYAEKQNYDNKYMDLFFTIFSKAYELVELSNDIYQVEKTISLNKISLKDYILNSPICNSLKNNSIIGYSIEELKQYMDEYEKQGNEDITTYKFALKLYENFNTLEDLENKKIEIEFSRLINVFPNLAIIKSISKEQYQELYNNLLIEAKEKYLDNNLIDEKIYDDLKQILNDLINYYLYGNRELPLDEITN